MAKICRIIEKELLDYMEKNLPADRIRAIEEHKASCVRCDHLIKQFNALWSHLPKMERVQPSDSFWSGVQAKIQEVEGPPPLAERIFAGLKMILRPAAMIMTLLTGLYFGYQMGNLTDDHRELSINNTINTDEPGKVFVEVYLQDFQEILAGSPAEFYLQTKQWE